MSTSGGGKEAPGFANLGDVQNFGDHKKRVKAVEVGEPPSARAVYLAPGSNLCKAWSVPPP